VAAFPSLRRKAEFEAIASAGSTRSTRLLVLKSLPRVQAPTRIGFSVSRAVGGAVQRNRVKRRLRELVRERYDELETGWDLLLIARPDAARATYPELREALGSLLRRSSITS
jgi:ribonuclease P protein component